MASRYPQDSRANSLVRTLLKEVYEQGIDYPGNSKSIVDGKFFRELLNTRFELTQPRSRLFTSHAYPALFNPGLAAARFFYLLSGSHRLDDITHYSKSAQRFTDDGLVMPGSSYGSRIFYPSIGINQFDAIANMITNRYNTRRAAIAIYQPADASRESRDIPCCMNIVFAPRNGQLHMTLMMRANNVYKLLAYNLFEFSLLMEFMASYIDYELGSYFHINASSHIFEADLAKIPLILSEGMAAPIMNPMPKVDKDTRLSLVGQEAALRAAVGLVNPSHYQKLIETLWTVNQSYWADLLTTVALQGFLSTHGMDEAEKLINTLDLSSDFVVSHAFCDYCVRYKVSTQRT